MNSTFAPFRILEAHPHAYGNGKKHGMNGASASTLCGMTLSQCPGALIPGAETDIDCRRCLKAIETAERREYWKQKSEEAQAQREEDDRQWRQRYNAYLNSPEWREKRRRVLARSPLCEGCGKRPSIQAHHMTYKRLGREMLFDLRAVCKHCHDEIHV